jgi:Trypsin-like peptidase domain
VFVLKQITRLLFTAPLWLALSCSASVADESGLRVEPIVYGEDDRADLYEVEPRLEQLARSSAVALLSPSQLHRTETGSYVIHAPPYAELQELCPGERFAEQPAAASCSGVLVAPDLVVTAGHCFGVTASGGVDCTNDRYVLGFWLSAPNPEQIVIPSDAVFDCQRVLGRVVAPVASACRFDIAVIQLDRPVADATTQSLRATAPQQAERLTVIGYPAGLPVKIDTGAQVMDARAEAGDFFTLSSDTFAISSGSGVFDAEGTLIGLFARGRTDYDQDGTCQRVHRESEGAAPAFEEATKIAAVQELLHAVRPNEWKAPARRAQTCDASEFLSLGDENTGSIGAASMSHPAACAITTLGAKPRHAAGAGTAALSIAVVLALTRRRTGR